MDGTGQYAGAGCPEEGSVEMSRCGDLLRACDAMSPQEAEAFRAMIWSQEAGCCDLPGVRRIWEETRGCRDMTGVMMFQYGVIIGKRMERMKKGALKDGRGKMD